MIKAYCDNKDCGKLIKGSGALVFSPPKILPSGRMSKIVKKFHLCQSCWVKLKKMLGK